MKILVVHLFFGAFFSCFYFKCEGLGYYRHAQDQGDDMSENTFIDNLGHHRSRRNSLQRNADVCKTINCTEKINHKYYVSQIISNGQSYWRDIQANPKTKTQTHLSDHYLKKQEMKLSFKFPYYGHYLDSVVVTTGGFLYMDVHNTRLITDVQYLAPLMAYFNSNLTKDSKVLTLDDGEQLTVQWLNVLLHNKTDAGPFNFQCTLHKNGTIWFAYKQVPVSVDSIPNLKYHPVRVGISDAFVIFYWNPLRQITYRFFFIYSQVNITKKSVVSGSAVIFDPQPSCVVADSCTQCMQLNQTTEFNCQWCHVTERCSDGADRHRAEWEEAKCSSADVKKISDASCVAKGRKEQRKSEGGMGAGGIIGICMVLVLVICAGAWCSYAYLHPTSKSGLFLIDVSRRPREFLNRSSSKGGKTGDAAPSDIKPQVL